VAKDYFERTGFFPIVHVVGIRRELAEKHPWLPGAVLKAFEQAKELGLRKPSDTSATKVTLPFVEERLKEARDLMGRDFWSYGVGPNRKVLDISRSASRRGPVVTPRPGRRDVSPSDL
jgi:4,5-dihydroxyphthalate decarboxylase